MKHELTIPVPGCVVRGELRMAEHPSGIVVLVHGSGTDRHDARNRFVAASLVRAGFGALLVDLLEDCAAHERHDVFAVDLQAARLAAIKDWLRAQPATRSLGIGYFASGVGAGVALLAAARAPQGVRAVVCRGGRPDTALHGLARLQAPSLFIAPGEGADAPWVKAAYRATGAEKELVRVAHAGDAFREPGAIETVSEHACRWFARYLVGFEAQMRALEARLGERHPGAACHATVEEHEPHAFERRRYHVRLDVAWGGRSFVVNREHDDDPSVALREAFTAANRQLAALQAPA
jgi:putative phosphoribosyl transferase